MEPRRKLKKLRFESIQRYKQIKTKSAEFNGHVDLEDMER
jgi:hypothetical protein